MNDDTAAPAAEKIRSDRPMAAALRYRAGEDCAPKVVAAGRGEVAERIIALAALNDVPVREDPDLMAMLEAIEVGAEIPPEAFAAVAEILVYLFRANATLGGQAARPQPEA